jgi:aldose 1-epimerase
MKKIFIASFILLIAISGCKKPVPESAGPISDTLWEASDSIPVKLITLTNKNGMQIKITNFAAVLTYVGVPDKAGNIENVVLGFDSLAQYKAKHPYFGSTIGRFANRIGGSKFVLNDTTYTLLANEGPNTLHGGPTGFWAQVFSIDTVFAAGDSMVVAMSRLSRDLEGGYPGNLKVKVTYILTANNEIKINYEAETDKPTVLNLTNHSYFNLSALKEDILGQELVLYADSITPVDAQLIPTGKLTAVSNTSFDFTSPHTIGERIAQVPGGYDINYKLRNKTGEYVLAAEVYDPKSGRLMQTYTTEPGIQFYSGNFLNGIKGRDGVAYNKYFGLCLEAQHFPDSPNKPNFPSTVLLPGEKYTQKTTYKFSVK